MAIIIAMSWEEELKHRLGPQEQNSWRVSIKVRPNPSGCFHCRGCCPNASKILDAAQEKFSGEKEFRFLQHETGPEIIVKLAVAAASLGLAKSVIELVTAIIKARSDGQKKGDKKHDPIEVIIRGFDKDKKIFDESVLQIPPGEVVPSSVVKQALIEGIQKHIPTPPSTAVVERRDITRSKGKKISAKKGKKVHKGKTPFSDIRIQGQ